MSDRAAGGPRADVLLDVLGTEGVTHLVGLPDSTSAALLDLALRRGTPTFVPVTREGEAFALASGLWLGGARPVVVIQNTGLLESGDALRGTAARMGVPLPVLVTWRGHTRMPASGDPDSPAPLVDPDVDSAAVLTRPTLRAWRVPWTVWPDVGNAGGLRELMARARRERRPVALLLPRRLQGPC